MRRVLVFAATTGYQTRAFGEAAERVGVELVLATDRCNVLEDPWHDQALAVRFHDEAGSLRTIVDAARGSGFDGVLAVGDRPTLLAARAAEALGLPWHAYDGARAARDKRLTRERLSREGLLVPWFRAVPIAADPRSLDPPGFPCVLKPAALSGSRGVMRVDDEQQLAAAFGRLKALLEAPDVRAERSDAHAVALLEGFIEGAEFAVEGVMTDGRLRPLAIFDKPDPLDGPFFEETIYVTPSQQPAPVRRAIAGEVARAARAIGLGHGPVHAECRVNGRGVFVLEVAARPIGGLCAQALRFARNGAGPLGAAPLKGAAARTDISLEELLLRHALGEPIGGWERERSAAGVMMIPIPRRGVYRDVAGVDAARAVAGIEDVRITAKPDQALVPLPEGASYLGFIFARTGTASAAAAALRAAHARLAFTVDPEVRVLQSAHG